MATYTGLDSNCMLSRENLAAVVGQRHILAVDVNGCERVEIRRGKCQHAEKGKQSRHGRSGFWIKERSRFNYYENQINK
jgi:hypothetical protein